MTTVLLPWPLFPTNYDNQPHGFVSTLEQAHEGPGQCHSTAADQTLQSGYGRSGLARLECRKICDSNTWHEMVLATQSWTPHPAKVSAEKVSEGRVGRQANLLLLQMQHHSLPSLLPPISHSLTLRQYKCHLRPASYI